MPTYAVAYMYDVDFNAELIEYIEKIDETLTPYGGKFLAHGGRQKAAEGPANAAVVILEFPEYQTAMDWYRSPAYQEILPLRVENTTSVAILAEGCGDDHKSVDLLTQFGIQR
ncbi:DUF1330 domain-containing protein [Nocardia uniformis]|uniref:DUF1330 domain-containing protein n=1 Tax=Nocardia uniformis TaxID=53432 RepID=A0A849BTM7_9NOCA|nr:DUF1330 domain-containing protein [Nocardia uniformis]NNH69953.1 DUF1330 domain-containing protein [Nocardia uniformis]